MKRFRVKLQRNNVTTSLVVTATSETNARYKAEQQKSGWTAIDVQPA